MSNELSAASEIVAKDSEPRLFTLSVIPVKEVVAKSIKALNHEEHEGHKGKEKLFFVLFVVPFFSELFATTSLARMTA